MLIRVTQRYIDHGIPERCGACPVALATIDALLEATGRAFRVSVYRSWIAIRDSRGLHLGSVSTPYRAAEFIDAFDARSPVQPSEFNLDLEFLLDPAVTPAEACTDSPCDL